MKIEIHEETYYALKAVMRQHHNLYSLDDAICFLLKLAGIETPHNAHRLPNPARAYVNGRWVE